MINEVKFDICILLSNIYTDRRWKLLQSIYTYTRPRRDARKHTCKHARTHAKPHPSTLSHTHKYPLSHIHQSITTHTQSRTRTHLTHSKLHIHLARCIFSACQASALTTVRLHTRHTHTAPGDTWTGKGEGWRDRWALRYWFTCHSVHARVK